MHAPQPSQAFAPSRITLVSEAHVRVPHKMRKWSTSLYRFRRPHIHVLRRAPTNKDRYEMRAALRSLAK
eukprot:2435571-Pleurochrysis_carterae.AAC.1